MNKKKIISLLLGSIMSASILAGCGGEKTVSTGEEETVITIWTNNSHSKSVMDSLVNDWNNTEGKEKGIRIDYIVKGDDYTNQIQMAINADDTPDIFLQGASQKNVEAGVVAVLTDYPEAQEWLKGYEGYLEQYKNPWIGSEQKIVTVPKALGVYGLVYNKDMFKAAGIVDENGEAKPPKTYDEMVEIAKKLTNPEKKEYGIIFPVKWGGWTTTDIVYPALVSGGKNSGYDRKTGTFDYSDIAPIMKAILQIKHDGSCYPGAESLDNDPARALFSEGRIGMKFAGDYDVGVFTNQFPAKCDWGVAEYPSEKADVRYKNPVIFTEGGVISTKAIERVGFEKVFEVYKWFNSDELARELYKEGLTIPYKYEIYEDIVDECKIPQIAEFAKITETSANVMANINSKPEGFHGQSIQSLCANDFWYEKKPIDETLAAYSKACTEGIDTYIKENPDYNTTPYIDPDWDIRIK